MSTTTLGGAVFMWAPLPADAAADAAGNALYPEAGDGPGDGGWPAGSAACRLSVDGSGVGSTVLQGNSGESVPVLVTCLDDPICWRRHPACCVLWLNKSLLALTVVDAHAFLSAYPASKSGGAVALMQCASRFRNARLSGNRATLGGGAVLSILRSADGGTEVSRANIFTNMSAGALLQGAG